MRVRAMSNCRWRRGKTSQTCRSIGTRRCRALCRTMEAAMKSRVSCQLCRSLAARMRSWTQDQTYAQLHSIATRRTRLETHLSWRTSSKTMLTKIGYALSQTHKASNTRMALLQIILGISSTLFPSLAKSRRRFLYHRLSIITPRRCPPKIKWLTWARHMPMDVH